MTAKMPRDGSQWSRSSLTSRCDPGSELAAARMSRVAPGESRIIRAALCTAPIDTTRPARTARRETPPGSTAAASSSAGFTEVQEHRVGQADPRHVRHGGLGAVLAPGTLDLV